MNTEETAVAKALSDWYDAIQHHDARGIEDALTPDFLLIEHDELIDRASLVAGLIDDTTAGYQTAELSEFHITIEGDIAWSTHRNEEVWYPVDGEPLELGFLETVVLRRVDGSWLIDRYHATRLRPDTLERPTA